ncbi:TonB-dependent siderophore receptor [Sphingomonas bacterium]|uniref:TonB-dependent siderophore receptor n=1 Tax=Sphingomonas bacterium TaxID=1895847 RepID=UPI0020C64FDA|nr:TonB-dependent siderophore receptor [Sphingomonas bacterium]
MRETVIVVLAGAMLAHPVFAKAESGSSAPQSTSEGTTDTIVVTGQRPVSQSSAGTKTDTPIAETPQSVTVLSSGMIQGLGLQNLTETLRYVAGVTPDQRGSSAEVYDLFSLRGFGAPVFLDGLFYISQSDQTGYAAAQADISRLDRVEVIKGPSSALYGRSGPGGLVVEESKLPLDRDFYGALAGTYGSYDLYRVDGDVGGRFSDSALWRLYGSVNGAHDQQRYGTRRRQTVSATTTLGNGTPTSFTLLAAYSHDPRNGDYGVFPAYGTLIPNPAGNGRVSSKFYDGEPNDFFAREQAGITYIFRHDFGDGWAIRSLGRYQYVHSRLGIVYIQGTAIDPTVTTSYARGSYATNETNNDWVYDNQLTGKLTTGPLQHELLFGADRQVLHFNEFGAFGTATPIDPFDPVYGTTATPRTPQEVPGGFPFTLITHQRQQSVYAQDQISLAGLRLTLSGRQDWARSENGGPVQHDSKFTYRAGALYKTALGIAPYVSYSTSFQPQAATLIDGTLAKPSLGKQIEGGVKYQVPHTEILVTAAYFHIEQSNVLSYDPVTFFATQSGKVRSRGVEVEAKAPLPHGFNAMFAFSRQSVKVLDDLDPNNVGHGLPTVGRGGVSGNLEWAPRSGPLAGFAIGGGVRHVDRVYAYGANNSPSYTLFDALARYDLAALGERFKGIQVSINAKNLTNKRYLTGCYVNYDWCWYGARRTVQGTIGFAF